MGFRVEYKFDWLKTCPFVYITWYMYFMPRMWPFVCRIKLAVRWKVKLVCQPSSGHTTMLAFYALWNTRRSRCDKMLPYFWTYNVSVTHIYIYIYSGMFGLYYFQISIHKCHELSKFRSRILSSLIISISMKMCN